MATSRCNTRHDGVTEVEDLVLKGLERPWTFSNNSALSVGFFFDFVPFSASSMLLGLVFVILRTLVLVTIVQVDAVIITRGS